MNTDIHFTNSFSNMQLSQTQKENPESYDWMGQTQNEMGLNFGKEEKLENAYDKLTQIKETVSTDIQQTILETDNYKDIFDMLGYGSPYSAIQTLSKYLSFSKKSSDLPNNVVNPDNDNAYSGPRALRDGGQAEDSGLQFREDKLISGTGKNQYGLTSGGGTTGGGLRVKEDISQRIPFYRQKLKKFGSAAKGVSQKVISDFATESICSIIDSSREKGLQNTEISKILTKHFVPQSIH
ncbi:unnamed protein product [Mytilus edulis]|uniref:Uncharacterized protein n=1 Tax=Mytilus edulis TaxID=6550 RepID=A0A8S3Q6V3_MYTED|nr:unnamed protein product [Mytilus edulis]